MLIAGLNISLYLSVLFGLMILYRRIMMSYFVLSDIFLVSVVLLLLNLKMLVSMKYKNNPFNIRYTGQQWLGLAGHKNGFCEFESLDYGIRAWLILMRSYRCIHNICTIRKIVKRFAPPSENNTSAYIDFVSKRCLIPPDRYLNFQSQYFMIGIAMSAFESDTDLSLTDFYRVAQKFDINIVS